jgi:hypothetical protein
MSTREKCAADLFTRHAYHLLGQKPGIEVRLMHKNLKVLQQAQPAKD